MNLWKISIKNIQSKPLYSLLSVFMLSLSIALLLGIQQLKTSFQHQMENNLGEINLVVGAKGSPLQLVLSSVLHLDNPTGNIPYKEAIKMNKNPLIKMAVPISYGDNYKGYRIVGTTKEFYNLYDAKFAKGNPVEKSMQVVLGSQVANILNLKLGDKIRSSHGLIENSIDIHDDELTVVGILKPTQKVIDRLIVTNLESIWDVHNHKDHNKHTENQNHKDEHHIDKEHNNHNEHNHDEDDNHENDNDDEHHNEHQNEEHNNSKHIDEEREVTALLVTFRSPTALLMLPRRINEDTNMQAALPKYELERLYKFTGVGFQTISWIAYIILFISGITIFISLYKMIKERAFDLALLRTYGASNLQLIKIVAYEGLILVGFAFVVGFLFTKAGLYILMTYLENNNQQNILQSLPFNEVLQIIGLVFVMIVLSISFAIYPILKMNISSILSNEK